MIKNPKSKKNNKSEASEINTQNVESPESQEHVQPINASTEELTADLKRLQAEFINYKNRVEIEKATLSQFAKIQVIKELLPVIDDLERALAHLPEELKDNKWAQGTSKAYARLQKQLEKLGVTTIDSLNQPFNPELHEAVQVEGDGENQIVSEVLQQGYQLEDRVIRHSVVKVINS